MTQGGRDDHRQGLKELFEAARQLPAEAREQWLNEACGGEPGLRAEVESLLLADSRAGSFLESPALASVEAAEAVLAATLPVVAADRTGRRIGPYRIVRELGHGGMGVVYLAARDDLAFDKLVAIKVVQGSLPRPALLERFYEERRILAALDHVNVARLLDAGTTDDGVPYVVMEYVEGQPIDAYCRTHGLATRKRLELFGQVCDAVQYSHHRLVVHRDIKAGNILVTAEGVPKLLDFGIARILETGEGGLAATRTALRALTPESASPEQVRGETVTVSSDVYSLGILLYRLLSDQSPYASQPRSDSEIVRAICEEQPPRPSEVVAAGAGRELRGELDLITLKALRKEPERRYASVRDLANDIQRHLQGLPVEARPDTLSYRSSKFVRRHRAAVAAALLLVASLAGGLLASFWQWRRAETAHREAERRFDDTRRLAGSLLFEVHDAIQSLPGSTKARELIVKRAVQYLDGLATSSVDDSVKAELAAGYLQLGDVQGRPSNASLGDTRAALDSYRKAVRLAEAAAASPKPPPAVRELLARAYGRLAEALRAAGEAKPADALLTKAVAIIEARNAEDPTNPTLLGALAATRFDQAAAHADAADWAGALASYTQAAGVYESLARKQPERAQHRRNLALVYRYMGGASERLLRSDEALRLYKQAIAIDRDLVAAEPNNATARLDLSFDLASLAKLDAREGRLDPAIGGLRETLELRRSVLEADPVNAQAHTAVARAHGDLAELLSRRGERRAAEAEMRRSVAESEKLASSAAGSLGPRLRFAWALLGLGDTIAVKRPGTEPSAAELSGPRGSEACALYRRGQGLFAEIADRLPLPNRELGKALSGRLASCERRSLRKQTPGS